MKIIKMIKNMILILLFILILGIVGKMDYESEQEYRNFCVKTYGVDYTKN